LAQQIAPVDQQLDYTVQAAPSALSNVSYFRVHSPTAASGQSVHLIASVTNQSALQNVNVTVLDANQNVLAARVLGNVTGATVVQADNIQPDTDYIICVSTVGTFNMTVDFTTKVVPFTLGSTGTASTQMATLTVLQSQDLYFVLSANSGNGTAVVMTIYDANGNVICVLTAAAGSSASTSVFLATGQYQVVMTTISMAAPSAPPMASAGISLGSPASGLGYTLSACTITDPIGAPIVNPTSNPTGSTPPPIGPTAPPIPGGPTVYWTADVPGAGSLWF